MKAIQFSHLPAIDENSEVIGVNTWIFLTQILLEHRVADVLRRGPGLKLVVNNAVEIENGFGRLFDFFALAHYCSIDLHVAGQHDYHVQFPDVIFNKRDLQSKNVDERVFVGDSKIEVKELFDRARAGDCVAIGEILEPFRSYLTLLARIQIGKRLQSKADPADVVQEVFLDAFKQFPGFRGETEDAVSGWLLRILAGHLARLIRRYFVTEARNVRLEVSIERELDSSTDRLARDFASQESSPSERVRQREEVAQLAEMLERLPPDYREVILLRQIEGIQLSEVAQRMGRSEDSVQKLWFRGLKALRDLMNKD